MFSIEIKGMKIVVSQGEELYVMPDTVLLRGGERYYVPNFACGDKQEVIEGVAIKITRIVKSIEARFAHRAWQEWSECRDYRLLGVHHTIGRCFDRSFEIFPHWNPKCELSEEQQDLVDSRIAYVSNYVSLRIGDYLFISKGELYRDDRDRR